MSSTDTAPWTGYYAIRGSQAVALVHKNGIWFEMQRDTSQLYADKYYTFHVADPDLLIVHQPHNNAEFTRLRQSTNTHGIATSNNLPPPVTSHFICTCLTFDCALTRCPVSLSWD